jgi:ATP-dependent helicase/nuclease subunit A
MTIEQDHAADPTSSAWVSASAGTGKTYVLTNRVLRLLLDDADPHRILCLTFTKAAAAEMANRINERLSAWVSMPETELRQELMDLAVDHVSPDLLINARQLFVQVLDSPGGLQISTIHAFCQSLMARFPLESGISPHFSVMDDRTAAGLRHESIIRLFARASLGTDPELVEAVDFITENIAETTFNNLANELMTGRRSFFDISDRAVLESSLRQALDLPATGSAPDALEDACQTDAFDKEGLLQAVSALQNGTKKDLDRAVLIEDWLSQELLGRTETFHAYTRAFLTTKFEIFSKLATNKVVEEFPTALVSLQAEADRVLQVATSQRLFSVLQSSMILARFGSELAATYATLKQQAGFMDYDDLIERARSLVVGNNGIDGVSRASAATWVLYKLDGGIDHILVDEAQDTNSAQWEIIETLANSFFDNIETADRLRTMFAVGDPKQSIYSFQGAEPAEFVRSRRDFELRVSQAQQQFYKTRLDLSFRSTDAVLALVDSTFANPAAGSGLFLEDEPTGLVHLVQRKRVPGLVELWAPEEPAVSADTSAWSVPVQQQFEQAAHVVLAERIAGQIHHWISSDTQLESRGRPISAGDILILVRRRNAFFGAMVRALKTRGIDVAGMDRMVLNDQLAVMDLIALGRFVLMPEDDLNLAVVMKSPLVGLDDSHLIDLAPRREGTLWHALGQAAGDSPTLKAAYEKLQSWLGRADFMAPYEFYSQVLDAEGGRRALLSRLGPDAEDPIEEFLGLTLEFERNNAPSLEGFLHWVEASATEVKREMEQAKGQVRVMTVHGAKGLQAPIVFLPDTRGVPKSSPSIFWLGEDNDIPAWPLNASFAIGAVSDAKARKKAAQLQEHNRQLYVAMTRAEDQLYVCGFDTNTKAPDECWYNLIDSGFEALENTLEATDWRGEVVRRHASGDRPETVKPVEPVMQPGEPVPSWALAPPGPEPTPSRPLAPSRPAGADVPVRSPIGPDMANRFLRGTLIHKLLEVLPEVVHDQRATLARQILGQPTHELHEATIEAWTDEVTAILDSAEFASLFGPDSLAEVPLTGLVGEVPISGVVDRLLVQGDRIQVVDYKTNRPPPRSADDVPSAYLQQMATYRDLLRQIYPDRTVECALLWTDGPTLMVLDQKSLDDHSYLNTVS